MVMQARIVSAALKSSTALEEDAKNIIENLGRDVTSRIRVINRDGLLLADSSTWVEEPIKVDGRYTYKSEFSSDESFLYSIVRKGLDIIRYITNGPSITTSSYEYYSENSYLDGVEIQTALSGGYGATTRISPGLERSITLYSALPILGDMEVTAVVLLSKSTYGILQDLYELRLEILKIFLISLLFAFVLSLILAKTIGGPLKRLRAQAKEIIDHKGRLLTHFRYSKRQDEIGDLSLSLETLTKKMKDYLNSTEHFATDISHEFKNPLASIKTATDILKQGELSTEDLHFIKIIDDEVARLNRLITEVRDISLIDNRVHMEDNEEIILCELIHSIIERYKITNNKLNFDVNCPDDIEIIISPVRFTQVIENILSNAVSFSPENSTIRVNVMGSNKSVSLSITNEGPNIPNEHLDKIFNRFFTYREGGERRNSGLGLSICKAIISGYGGSIGVKNIEPTGCEFNITLLRR